MTITLLAPFALFFALSCSGEKSGQRQNWDGGSAPVAEKETDTMLVRPNEPANIHSAASPLPIWFERQTPNTNSVMLRSDFRAFADKPAFKALIKRNRERALWLLRNPELQILPNSDRKSRFNGRICTRIVAETRTAIDFAEVSIDGSTLSESQQGRLRARGLKTLREILAEDPYTWKIGFDPNARSKGGLEVAEMGGCLALGYRAFYELLSATEKRRIDQALLFVISRYLAQYNAYFGSACASTCKSNWNGVINGSAMMIAAVIKDFPAVGTLGTGSNVAADMIQKARAALPKYFELFGPDGVYSEGVTYVVLPMEFIALGHEMALANFGISVRLSDFPGVLQSGRFLSDLISPVSEVLRDNPAHDGLASLNYSDTKANSRPSLALLGWLGFRFGQNDMAALTQKMGLAPMGQGTLSDFGLGTMDAFSAYWYRPVTMPVSVRASSKLYGRPGNNSMIGLLTQKDRAGNPFYAAVLGGKSIVTPHGHLDAGSFVIEALGRRWSADLGPDYYDNDRNPGYFQLNPAVSPNRWHSLRASNLGHNTLTIDGSLQKPGAISPLSIASDVDGQKVTALLTEAYEGKASQVIRRLTATKHGKFLVSDVVKLLDVNSVVTWRMNYCRQTSTYVANTSPSVAPCFDPGSTRPTLRVELLPDQRGVRITEDQLDAKSCSPRYMDIETEVGSGLVVSVVSAEVGNSDCKAVLIRSPANSGVQRIINVTMTPKTGNPVWP